MPVLEATKVLIGMWREGDVALLEGVGTQLGVHVPDQRRPAADTEG